jgi:hypothetical protein
MADDLKERLVKLSDEELIDMVQAPAGEYRQDALDIAKAELKWRRVEIPEKEESDSEPAAVSYDPVIRPSAARDESDAGGCPSCKGGPLRPGTLVAEKELTVVFSDNHEERFVKVIVCTQCGQVSLIADFETDVQQ